MNKRNTIIFLLQEKFKKNTSRILSYVDITFLDLIKNRGLNYRIDFTKKITLIFVYDFRYYL
jgi:hypothetical protein